MGRDIGPTKRTLFKILEAKRRIEQGEMAGVALKELKLGSGTWSKYRNHPALAQLSESMPEGQFEVDEPIVEVTSVKRTYNKRQKDTTPRVLASTGVTMLFVGPPLELARIARAYQNVE